MHDGDVPARCAADRRRAASCRRSIVSASNTVTLVATWPGGGLARVADHDDALLPPVQSPSDSVTSWVRAHGTRGGLESRERRIEAAAVARAHANAEAPVAPGERRRRRLCPCASTIVTSARTTGRPSASTTTPAIESCGVCAWSAGVARKSGKRTASSRTRTSCARGLPFGVISRRGKGRPGARYPGLRIVAPSRLPIARGLSGFDVGTGRSPLTVAAPRGLCTHFAWSPGRAARQSARLRRQLCRAV